MYKDDDVMNQRCYSTRPTKEETETHLEKNKRHDTVPKHSDLEVSCVFSISGEIQPHRPSLYRENKSTKKRKERRSYRSTMILVALVLGV